MAPGEKILSGYEVMVYPRRGFDLKLLEELLQWCGENMSWGVHLIDAPLVDISSSEIRNAEDWAWMFQVAYESARLAPKQAIDYTSNRLQELLFAEDNYCRQHYDCHQRKKSQP